MMFRGGSRIADIVRAAAAPAVILLVVSVLLRFPPGQYGFYPLCPVHEFLHLQCPGCGATRAVAALLHGQFAEAMHFNALVTLMLPLAGSYGVLCYTRFVQRKPIGWPEPPRAAMYAAFAATVIFTAIRNLPHGST
jgi:hypothetical protein